MPKFTPISGFQNQVFVDKLRLLFTPNWARFSCNSHLNCKAYNKNSELSPLISFRNDEPNQDILRENVVSGLTSKVLSNETSISNYLYRGFLFLPFEDKKLC